MTKLAQVIWIFFLISFYFIFTFQVSAGFEDLIKPIPEDNIPHLTFNNEQASTQPSVTFGDLLNNNATPSVDVTPITTQEAQIASKTAQFKKLLADLEASYQTTLVEFNTKREQSISFVPSTPTPFISIPTLVANVSDIASYQKQNGDTFPTPTLTDTLLLASLSNPKASEPPPTPVQPTTNILGTISQNPVKTTYTIALLGDSMTDTLGRDLPHLRNLLKGSYPNYSFSLLNYGQGGTDLDSGLYRLTNATNYLGTDYPPLLSFKPDILVVESFAYNHWSGEKYDLDRQWLTIAKIIDTIREKSPDTKIILAATIAPNKYIFGDGVLNWPKSLKENSSLIIKAYLQNLVNFATSEHYPLVDAYHPSLDSSGNGLPEYINIGDHLHPSPEGAYLYSQKIVEAIKNNALIN